MTTKGKAPKSPDKTGGGGKLGTTTKKGGWNVASTNPNREHRDHWEGKGGTKGKKNDAINTLGSPAYNMSNQNKFEKKKAKTRTKSNPTGK